MTHSTVLGLTLWGLTAIIGASLGQGVACPERFVGIGGKCYHFSDATLTWNEARTYCQGLVDAVDGTADLAVFAAHYVDFNKIVTHMESEGITASFWVGLTDVETETEWVWLDGRSEKRSSVMWSCGVPEEDDTSNCAVLYTNTADYLPLPRIQLHDKSCSSVGIYSLCELSPAA